MPVISVRIPQLGEGLQEALLVELLKQPGDKVLRDEPLYTMETDKGTSDVESPYEGTLIKWLVEAETVQPIGAAIAEMEVAEGVEEMPVGHGLPTGAASSAPKVAAARPAASESTGATRNRAIPPRTRRYLREKGLLEEADLMPSKTGKLAPEDVDAYLAAKAPFLTATVKGAAVGEPFGAPAPKEGGQFNDAPLSKSQQKLNYRLARGAQICIPVTTMVEVDWSAVQAARQQLKEIQGDVAPSAFVSMLWCVVRAMEKHAKFRSTLVGSGTVLRTFQQVNIGIAVALPDDLLASAVVHGADQLGWSEFSDTVTRQVELARSGQDQATAATTLSVSNIGAAGAWAGMAAVVAPAVATLTLGQIHEKVVSVDDGYAQRRVALLALTFDHRILNGVGAANFMNEVKRQIEEFQVPE